MQRSRTTSTELLHATLAGLGPRACSHNHDVSTATVIPATGANRREPAEVLDAVGEVHGVALGILAVVVDEHELVAQALLHDGARHGKPNAPTPPTTTRLLFDETTTDNLPGSQARTTQATFLVRNLGLSVAPQDRELLAP